ncbi:hypothetical protein, partial [Enterococcus faecalis]|uniref:hypothetical protein n=1 Tax=Enterococcus faecalis TaxID=1351 RepID=UPI00398625D3
MNFGKKFEVFWDIFVNHDGYRTVLTGLQNTLIIAVSGLLIGIVLGTIIGAIQVVPKNNPVIKVLDKLAVLY